MSTILKYFFCNVLSLVALRTILLLSSFLEYLILYLISFILDISSSASVTAFPPSYTALHLDK
jgi:hypothetical protein